MQNSHINNEDKTLQTNIQVQITIAQQQYNNPEIIRKKIKQFQDKIAQMTKLLEKRKKQNDTLKQQLKQLNDTVNNVINKVSTKQKQKVTIQHREDVWKKQLEIEVKKNVSLQKQLNALKAKTQLHENVKVVDVYNELKQKQKKIQQLLNIIKTHEKVSKQQKNMDIYKRQQQLAKRVQGLNEQIIFLKKKLNEHKKHEQLQQKNIKRQHEQIISLQTKYKTTTQSMAPSSKTLVLSRSTQKKRQASPNEQQYQKMKLNLQSLEATKKSLEKQYKSEIQHLKSKVYSLQQQIKELKDDTHRKDQQNNILTSKLRQIQRRQNSKTLQPVQIRKSEQFPAGSLFDQRKQFRGLVHAQGNFRKFDDTESLTLEKNYKINKIVFTWFEEHILSLDTIYQLHDGSIKQVASFRITHPYKNIKFGELNLTQFQYIKDIQIFCGKFIEFMRFQTSRQQTLEIGTDKNYLKCKKFNFDIRNHEKPIAFFGAIQNKKILGSEGKEVLISFGLQIKKKEVIGRSTKFGRTLRSDSLRKNPSRSLFDAKSKRNDKNIVQDQDQQS